LAKVAPRARRAASLFDRLEVALKSAMNLSSWAFVSAAIEAFSSGVQRRSAHFSLLSAQPPISSPTKTKGQAACSIHLEHQVEDKTDDGVTDIVSP
jgi:hypothetical protein